MKTSTIEEQLNLLKGITIRQNAIHEAQRLQLQTWLRMSDQIAKPVSVSVDFDSKTVFFKCKSVGKYRHRAFEKRLFKEVHGWTRSILWDNTEVVISVNKKVLFDSRK